MTPLRLAIVSTPRTGNNWLQHLLSRVYDLPRLSPVNLPNVRWSELASECVIILHWPPDAALLSRLDEQRFRVVSIARHPLDVLISILHFTLRETTDGWLQGRPGNERDILGLTPRSPGFLDYACGARARALLAISRDWWQRPDCLRVRYEDLTAAPQAEMERLISAIGVGPRQSIADAIPTASLASLRGQFPDRRYHFWQGTPGLWRLLLTTTEAEHIGTVHKDLFTDLGYICAADPQLTAEAADARWRDLLGITGPDVTIATLQSALFEVKREWEQARLRLAELESLGPTALAIARRLKQWGTKMPWLTRLWKRRG